MRKLFSLVILCFIAVGLMAACGGNNQQQVDLVESEENKPNQAEKGAFPVTIIDGTGTEVTIEEKPERIVSLIPSSTEILFSLGLNDEIVAVSDNDNYPEEALEKEKVGGMQFNVEKIISLEPDVVFADASSSHNSESGLDQLRDAGITIVVVNDANSFADVYKSIEMIAKATGRQQEGQEIIAGMKDKIVEIEGKASQISEEDEVTVWVEIEPAPELYTTGKNTFMHEMLETIHAKNAAGDQEGWPKYTEEDVVRLNPDVIVTTYAKWVENAVEQILSREAWQDVPAIKNQRVHEVDEDLVSRPGPRLAEGMEELAKVVYPQIFAE